MKKQVSLLIAAAALFFCSSYVYAGQQTIEFDSLRSENEENTLDECIDKFRGEDLTLIMSGKDQKYISELYKLGCASLNLTLDLGDEDLVFYKEMNFPSALKSVELLYDGAEEIKPSDALEYFVICMAAYCPEASINGYPVKDMLSWVYTNDENGMLDVYESNAKLNYVYGLVKEHKLEVMEGEPEYGKKLIIKIVDGTGLASVESLAFGENFYGFPSARLAKKFDDANTAVFIYPVSSLVGNYANGAEARAMYTKVCVVDLGTMKMYEPFNAVVDNPPEVLDITVENGKYSEDGYTGVYEPETAVQQVKDIVSGKSQKKSVKDDEARKALLPWLRAGIEFKGASKNAAATKAGTANGAAEAVGETATDAAATANNQANASEAQTAADNTNAANTETGSAAAAPVNEAETKAVIETAKEAQAEPYYWLTDEMLNQIFELLGDSVYKDTYTAIKNGRDIGYGSAGAAALGLQKTLTAFGKNIKLDSSIGNSSLGALKEVQVALGQEYTGKMTSKGYAQLMPALLIHLDEGSAYELFGEYMVFPDGNMFEFLKAGLSFIGGSAYTAKEMYENSKFGNYDILAQQCIMDMPATGQIYKDSNLTAADAVLTAEVNSQDEAASTCLRIYNTDGLLAACIMVRGSGKASASLPEGKYRITEGMGYRWYGMTEMFGRDGAYEELLFEDGTDVIELRKGYDYTLTFNVQTPNSQGQSVGAQEADWFDIIK